MKQKYRWLIWASAISVFFLFVLLANGAWGVAILVVLVEAAAFTLYVLRKQGIWKGRAALPGRAGCWIASLAALAVLIFLLVGNRLYVDWLWFDHLGYGAVFGTELRTRGLLFFGAGVVAALFLGGNMRLALNRLPRRTYLDEDREQRAQFWYGRAGPLLVWVVAAVGGFFFALHWQTLWMRLLRFLNGVTVGESDPIFGRDLGFYLFRLAFLLDLKNTLLVLTFLTLALCAVVYGVGIRQRRFPPPALAHLSILGTLFLLVKVWDYQLKRYLLLYSDRGVAHGAGYTDIHARLPAYNILSVIVLLCAVVLLFNIRRRTWALLAIGGGLWLASLLLVGAVYPALVQNFRVRPSELSLERPYIERSIHFTLKAYGLEDVEEQNYPVEETLTMEIVRQNPGTIGNIRLHDHRPLYDTYGQLQEIRLYYDFVDIDVERYRLGGVYREVELAARELSVDQLPDAAQTWVNRHLVYTHGYGIVLSPVNESCAEGQPCFFIRDIPPQTDYPELALERPEIYHGEDTDNYVIVHTTVDEFDYPSGDQNVMSRYQGSGGVPVGSFFRRLVFALYFGDSPILFSGNITPESRILYHRTIQDRVARIAPFLLYDYDPYPVILEGRLYWLQDAYTISSHYPYSEPYEGWYNYIRNAVKVVIDPYNGTTTYYIVAPEDPIVQTYARIFPTLFRPVEEMPAGLRDHWRYPEELFRAQASIYATYHMRDPQVFYNKEDAWHFAKEIYAGYEELIDSYYVIMRLPGWENEEFFLMVPFTPANRDNMIAWMHAQCDSEDYGKLGIFKFPKQTLVYGPFQIEARVNQDPDISRELTLWNQQGSQVLRGNLLVIPIENNLLYVEPLYLQAETGQIPELKRVIVAYNERIAMAETLDQALRQVLGTETTPPGTREWAEVARSAEEHYRRAQECLQQADWACYGEEMRALEEDLQELVRLSEE